MPEDERVGPLQTELIKLNRKQETHEAVCTQRYAALDRKTAELKSDVSRLSNRTDAGFTSYNKKLDKILMVGGFMYLLMMIAEVLSLIWTKY